MSGIAAVIEELIMTAVLSPKMPLAQKSKMDWALMALSVLLGCAGIFLSILALERFLEARYPLDIAALSSAVILLIIAALLAAVRYFCHHRKPAAPAMHRQELESNIHTLLKSICAELESPILENPKTAVLLAAITGFITAQRKI